MNPLALIAAIGALLTLSSGGAASGGQLRGLLGVALSAKQLAAVDRIEAGFAARGLPLALIAAAVANAKAESGLDPLNDKGDHGHSVGLFQLDDVGGAGIGYTVAQRQDADFNVAVILDREVMTQRGQALRAAALGGAGVGELAGLFCRDIERPGNVQAEMQARSDLAEQMFPSLA